MNKEQVLELLKLLSAIEGWAFDEKHYLPDFLHDRLDNQIDLLAKEILKGQP